MSEVITAPDEPEVDDGATVPSDSEPGAPFIERDLAPEAGEGTLPSSLIDEAIELELPAGCRTVVVSDLHLPTVATGTSTAVADEIAAILGECTGPAAFVIAGDGFEMLAGPPDMGKILDAHPQFTEAV